MSIYQEFTKPTYLYIKQHSKTGLKYFGRYTRSRVKDSVEMYRGSGTYWKNHIKLHGKQHVETLWYCAFLNQEEMTQFALMCSELWNIVESDEWANLMPEDGINGSPSDRIVSEETKLRMSISQTNRVVTKEQRESISKKLTGHKQKKEQVEKRIDSMSKWYTVTYPDGTVVIIKNMAQFCRDNFEEYGIISHRMYRVARGERKHHRGFFCGIILSLIT